MRVAIILPWVGVLPAHLSFTCQTMIGGLMTASLLLFFEESDVPEACRNGTNVVIEDLGHGGIAALHARRMAAAAQKKFELLFRVAPASLSEFKPAWGWVFGEYLSEYTHWTYTDTDVVFGQLDKWLNGVSFGHYDIETWSFHGDAGRLFLRGQWTLHKNENRINLLWQNCRHLNRDLEKNINYKLESYTDAFKLNLRRTKQIEGTATNGSGYECASRIGRFVSAEGCYTCVVLSSSAAAELDLRVKIRPLLLSDHSNAPVWWFNGTLVRCLPPWNSNNDACDEALKAWYANRQHDRTAASYSFPAMPMNAIYKHANVVHSCFDMRWICRSAPDAAFHALPDGFENEQPKKLEATDAVQLRPRGYRLPDVTLVMEPMADMKHNKGIIEAPLFHFRKWIDHGKWHSVSTGVQPHHQLLFFAIRKSGFHAYSH